MLTESCVMFSFAAPCCLSAILRDEYLPSVVRTKEGDKTGSNQPPAEVARPTFSTWPVEKSKPKAFEVCASIQNHQLAYRDQKNIPVRGTVVVLNCQRSRMLCIVDLNRRAYLKCLWFRFFHRSCWESWSWNFRIAFLEKFWKDWALIRMRHGYISSGSGAGIFEVRN